MEFHGDTGAVVRSWCGQLGNAGGELVQAVLTLADQGSAVPSALAKALALAILQHPVIVLAGQVATEGQDCRERVIQLAELLVGEAAAN